MFESGTGFLPSKGGHSFQRRPVRSFAKSETGAVLAVLIGCGLRRAEAVTVKIEDLQLRSIP
jgi:integrase